MDRPDYVIVVVRRCILNSGIKSLLSTPIVNYFPKHFPVSSIVKRFSAVPLGTLFGETWPDEVVPEFPFSDEELFACVVL